MARALTSYQCGPGSIPAKCGLNLMLLSPCSEGFSLGSPVFPLPQKPKSPNSNSKIIVDPYKNQLRLTWLPLSLNIVISLFLFLNPKRSFPFSLEQLSLLGGALLQSRPLQEVSRDPQTSSFFSAPLGISFALRRASQSLTEVEAIGPSTQLSAISIREFLGGSIAPCGDRPKRG